MKPKFNTSFVCLLCLLFSVSISGQNEIETGSDQAKTMDRDSTFTPGDAPIKLGFKIAKFRNHYYINDERVYTYQYQMVLRDNDKPLYKKYRRALIRGSWGKTFVQFSSVGLVFGGLTASIGAPFGTKYYATVGGVFVLGWAIMMPHYWQIQDITEEFNNKQRLGVGLILGGDGVGLALKF